MVGESIFCSSTLRFSVFVYAEENSKTLKKRYGYSSIATHVTSCVSPISFIRRGYADDVRFDDILAVKKVSGQTCGQDGIEYVPVLPTVHRCPFKHPQGCFLIACRGENISSESSYPRNSSKDFALRAICDLNCVMKNIKGLYILRKMEEHFNSEKHIIVATHEETVEWCKFQMGQRDGKNQAVYEMNQTDNSFLWFNTVQNCWEVSERSDITVNIFVDHDISLCDRQEINWNAGECQTTTSKSRDNALLEWTKVKTQPWMYVRLYFQENVKCGAAGIFVPCSAVVEYERKGEFHEVELMGLNNMEEINIFEYENDSNSESDREECNSNFFSDADYDGDCNVLTDDYDDDDDDDDDDDRLLNERSNNVEEKPFTYGKFCPFLEDGPDGMENDNIAFSKNKIPDDFDFDDSESKTESNERFKDVKYLPFSQFLQNLNFSPHGKYSPHSEDLRTSDIDDPKIQSSGKRSHEVVNIQPKQAKKDTDLYSKNVEPFNFLRSLKSALVPQIRKEVNRQHDSNGKRLQVGGFYFQLEPMWDDIEICDSESDSESERSS